jgi:hypothetical protein
MWRTWMVVALAAASMSPVEAHAFEHCDRLFASIDELRDLVFDSGEATCGGSS